MKKKNPLKVKTIYNWRYKIECPGCGKMVVFMESPIVVKVETMGRVDVTGLIQPPHGCRNPLCKWSAMERKI